MAGRIPAKATKHLKSPLVTRYLIGKQETGNNYLEPAPTVFPNTAIKRTRGRKGKHQELAQDTHKGNVFDIQCNKSISSCAAASGERCPSLHGHNFRNFCAWVHARKMEAGRSRSSKKYSMTDSIQNIQERTAGAISVASTSSAGVHLATSSERSDSKYGVLV